MALGMMSVALSTFREGQTLNWPADTMSVASSTSTRGAQTLDWLYNEIQREGGERKYVCDPIYGGFKKSVSK